jgi:hypothetical protein
MRRTRESQLIGIPFAHNVDPTIHRSKTPTLCPSQEHSSRQRSPLRYPPSLLLILREGQIYRVLHQCEADTCTLQRKSKSRKENHLQRGRPKISYGRLNLLYMATELGLKKSTSTVSRLSPKFLRDRCDFVFPKLAHGNEGIGANNESPRHHPVLLWEDVNKLLNRKYLVARHPGLNPEEPFHGGEDYGLFFEEPVHRNEFDWQQYSIWNQACVRWQNTLRGDRRWSISPTIAEMILLREFRYRFDPRWYPQTSLETDIKEYFRIAKV